jgi:16S rRNA processing protein RimM
VGAQVSKLVSLGRISGVHGVKGWVKVHSYTEPRENIVGFSSWVLRVRERSETVEVEAGRRHGAIVIAKLRGVDDRDRAASLVGAEIAVERAQLPACAPGEYYWCDLEGLEVRNVRGEVLGMVDHLLATGSNDVLVLAGSDVRMIPFIEGDVIRGVDLENGVIVADWPKESQ